MGIRVIVDSTSDLRPEIKERVEVVPLTLFFGEEEYIDGETITHEAFYEKLIETDVLPTTSQATPDRFLQAFQKVKEAGDEAIVLTLSRNLSGTYQSAYIAKEEYPEIPIVDSGTVTMGLGILVEYALDCIEKGMSLSELEAELNRKKGDICLIAMLDTLEYLKKGGRISKIAAFAGSVLNLKPVIRIKDGVIDVIGKARGSKQGNNLLIQEVQKVGGVDFKKPILLGYTGFSKRLLEKYVVDSKSLWEDLEKAPEVTTIGSVVGTHAGPGAIGVAFFHK